MNAQCHWYINEAYVHYVCCASIMLTLVVFHMSSRRNNNDNEDEVSTLHHSKLWDFFGTLMVVKVSMLFNCQGTSNDKSSSLIDEKCSSPAFKFTRASNRSKVPLRSK